MSVGERVLRVCEVVGARTGTEESAQLGMSRYPLVSPPLANSHASAAAATELSSQHCTASQLGVQVLRQKNSDAKNI